MGFERAGSAVADICLIDPIALVALFERYPLARWALITIAFGFVGKIFALKELLAAWVERTVGRHINGDRCLLAGLKLLAVGVAGIGSHGQGILFQLFFGGFSHWLELLTVVAILGDLVMQNQVMLGIHGALHVIGHTRSLGRAHHAGIAFVGVELLQAHRVHQRLAALIVLLPNFKLRQRCFDRAAINHLSLLGLVSLIQFGQILSDALIQLLFLTLELLEVHMAPRGSDRLKLAAIDGHQLACDQPGGAAKPDEGPARRHKGRLVVFAKVSDGLEVGLESVDQPHHFDVALALGFEPPR
ncbi:hypothetical protein D3C80_1114170 [compost metagenome]